MLLGRDEIGPLYVCARLTDARLRADLDQMIVQGILWADLRHLNELRGESAVRAIRLINTMTEATRFLKQPEVGLRTDLSPREARSKVVCPDVSVNVRIVSRMGDQSTRKGGATELYQPPKGLEYNEFIGELRPPNVRAFTELHVRYGVRDGRYLDWSITLRARLGDVEEFRESLKSLERRTLVVVEVANSTIRRSVYDPHNPAKAPETTVLLQLHAGDEATVDAEYDRQLRGLSISWAQKHGAAFGAPPHRHTVATFGFASKNRDPKFRDGKLSWVRNTLVCLEDDLADAVLTERAARYFPMSESTVGVLRENGRIQFIKADHKGKTSPKHAAPENDDAPDEDTNKATGDATMGMLVDSLYSKGWVSEVEDFLSGNENGLA